MPKGGQALLLLHPSQCHLLLDHSLHQLLSGCLVIYSLGALQWLFSPAMDPAPEPSLPPSPGFKVSGTFQVPLLGYMLL